MRSRCLEGSHGRRLAAVVVAGLVLTACSGGDTTGGSTDSAPVGGITSASESSVADEAETVGSSDGAPGGTPSQDAGRARLERFEAQATCLTDLGFASVAGSQGVQTEMTNDQADAFQAASEQCQKEVAERLGPDPAAAVLTEEQIGQRYDELLGVRDCLLGAGYPVTDPPSRQTWVSSYVLVQDVLQEAESGENRELNLPWNPFDEISSVDAVAQCPIPE